MRVERAKRHDVDAPGTIEGPTAIRCNVTIVNLSRSGCLVQGEFKLSIGDPVTIWLPVVGARQAKVRRIQGNSIGCAFDPLLKPSEVTLACSPPKSEDSEDVRNRIREARMKSLAPVAPKNGLKTRFSKILRRRKRDV